MLTVSLRGFVLWIECRFTSQTPPPSFWWGCSFLLPQSTSIIQGYKCFFIYIRACHRSRILNIKHTVGTFVGLQSNHGIDTLTRRGSSVWKRISEGTALTETLYPHLCFAKLFFVHDFPFSAGLSEDSRLANGYQMMPVDCLGGLFQCGFVGRKPQSTTHRLLLWSWEN